MIFYFIFIFLLFYYYWYYFSWAGNFFWRMTPVPPDTPPTDPLTKPNNYNNNVPRMSSVVASENLWPFPLLLCVTFICNVANSHAARLTRDQETFSFFLPKGGGLRLCRNPVFTTGARESPKTLALASRKLQWRDELEEPWDFVLGGGSYVKVRLWLDEGRSDGGGDVGGWVGVVGEHLMGQVTQVSFIFNLSNSCWEFDQKTLLTCETNIVLLLVSLIPFKKKFKTIFIAL